MRHVAALLRKRVILVVQDAVISLFGSDLTEDLALARLIPLHHGITLYLSLALRR
jgi:chromosome condensin MukBEF complex kleisin-like MukF subunit